MYWSSLRLYVCLSSVFMCCMYMICAECNLYLTSADFNGSLTCVISKMHVYALCKSG